MLLRRGFCSQGLAKYGLFWRMSGLHPAMRAHVSRVTSSLDPLGRHPGPARRCGEAVRHTLPTLADLLMFTIGERRLQPPFTTAFSAPIGGTAAPPLEPSFIFRKEGRFAFITAPGSKPRWACDRAFRSQLVHSDYVLLTKMTAYIFQSD